MVCAGDFTFRNTCCALDDNEKYVYFNWKTLWGEKTLSTQIVVSRARGRDPNNFTNLLITNSCYFGKCMRNSTFRTCGHLRWHCNNVSVTLILHKWHRPRTARVANRWIEKLPTSPKKLYFLIFLRRSCRRFSKIFSIWGQEQFKICKVLKTNSRCTSRESSNISELRLMLKHVNECMFISISLVQRFPNFAPRIPRVPWPVPRGSVDTFRVTVWNLLFN